MLEQKRLENCEVIEGGDSQNFCDFLAQTKLYKKAAVPILYVWITYLVSSAEDLKVS